MYKIVIYAPYLLDQELRLLIFSSCSKERYRLRAATIQEQYLFNELTHVLLIYHHVMMSCEEDMIKTTN